IVLNKVEVGGGDGAKRNAKVAHNRHGFQKYLWEQNGGAPIQVDAAGMHLWHQGAEEAEVEMRGGAKSGAVGGTVHVRNIGAYGEMHGDGDVESVGGDQDARVCVGHFDHGVIEKLACGFA